MSGVETAAAHTAAPEPSGFDPILVEVLTHELASLSEEMAIVIWRTGRSALVRTGDFATALCDTKGQVIAEGFAAPFQLAVFETFVTEVNSRFGGDISPGDIFLSNDPQAGMTHLPDVGVVAPAFVDGEHVGYAVAYSHHSDIGGRFPGGMSSESTSMFEEGLRIPIVKLYSAGRVNTPVIDIVRANVRAVPEWLGDLDAKVAGCRRGASGLASLVAKYGASTFVSLSRGLLDHAERAMRSAIEGIADGEHVVRDSIPFSDNDERVELVLTLKVSGSCLEVDFTGSSAQVDRGINTPLTMVRAAICGGLKALVATDVPANSGFFRPVRVVAPAGTIVNPTGAAPVAGRAPVFFRVFDLLFRAVGRAARTAVAVPGVGGDALHLTGESAGHGEFAMLDLFFGGWGARRDSDGIDGVAPVYMGSYGSMSVEQLERQFPVVVEGFGLVPDSEGAGKFRGASQVYRRWRLLEEAHAMVRAVSPDGSPGLEGGGAGPGASTEIVSADGRTRSLTGGSHHHFAGAAGDRICHRTAGAGGFGDPLDRDPLLVREDVLDGKISPSRAYNVYGVVLTDGCAVDVAATSNRRLQCRQSGTTPT